MSVLDWFKSRFRSDAQHLLYVAIPPSRVEPPPATPAEGRALEAGADYFRISLTQMFLKRDRNWFSSWHPAVHAAVTLNYGSVTQTLTTVAGPSGLKDLDDGHLDKVIPFNHPLTGLLPFNGGTVGLSAGLLAMKGANDVEAFISTLSEISKLLVLPELSAGLAVAGPLANGISSLVGTTNGQLMLGVDQTFVGAGGQGGVPLMEGFIAVVDATAAQVKPDALTVRDNQLCVDRTPLTGFNYMLLEIQRRQERDDWDQLSSIQEPYDQAIELLRLGQVEPAETSLRAAIAAAFRAKELTPKVDRRRVITALKQRFEEAKAALGPAAFAETGGGLASVMAGAMSVSQARSKPAMTQEEALAMS